MTTLYFTLHFFMIICVVTWIIYVVLQNNLNCCGYLPTCRIHYQRQHYDKIGKYQQHNSKYNVHIVQKDCRFDRKKLHEQNALDRIINWKRLRGAHINSWKTHCQCLNCLTPEAARACPHWRTMSQRIDVNACWSFNISHRFLDSLWER